MTPKTLTREEIVAIFATDDLNSLADLLDDRWEQHKHPSRLSIPETFGLTSLGDGASAVVMVHPHDPSLVVRVSEESDGWIAYACAGPDNPHKPRVTAVAWTGDCWVSVYERLHHISRDDAEAFIKRLWDTVYPGTGPASVSPELRELMRDVQERRLVIDDVEPRNVLAREDGTLVLNDPLSFMTFRQLRACRDAFSMPQAESETSFSP